MIDKNIEGLEEFQMRRVKCAISELEKEGEVQEWDVKAGLEKQHYDKLYCHIKKEMLNLNQSYCQNG